MTCVRLIQLIDLSSHILVGWVWKTRQQKWVNAVHRVRVKRAVNAANAQVDPAAHQVQGKRYPGLVVPEGMAVKPRAQAGTGPPIRGTASRPRV